MKIISVILLALFGLRNIDYGAILHPFSQTVEEIWSIISFENGYFWTKKPSEDRCYEPAFRHPAFWPWAPIFPIFFTFIYWTSTLHIKAPLWQSLVFGLLTSAAISLLIISLHLFLLMIAKILKLKKEDGFYKPIPFVEKWQQKNKIKNDLRAKQKEAQDVEVLNQKLRTLTCMGTPLVPKLRALPEEAKTIKLRFLDLKARVCRPYEDD